MIDGIQRNGMNFEIDAPKAAAIGTEFCIRPHFDASLGSRRSLPQMIATRFIIG